MVKTKTCPSCRTEKPVAEFNRCAGRPDGLQTACKTCHNIRKQFWRRSQNGRECLKENSRNFRERKRTEDPLRWWIATCFYNAKARAKRRNIPFELTLQDIEDLMVDKCPIFDIKLDYTVREMPSEASPSLDKLVPDLGYVPGNIAIISRRANTIKNNGSLEELEQLLNWLNNCDHKADEAL